MNIFSLSLCALALTSSAQVLAAPNPAPHRLLRAEPLPQTLGTNIHFTDARAGEMKMMQDGGFRRIRMDFTWGATERETGKYDFSAYERLLKSMDEHQMRAYWILDYGNRLYASSDQSEFADDVKLPAYRAAYAKWAAAAVAHFKDRNIVWEIWNEPNISGFWQPKPDVEAYSALALEACKAMRKVAPDECIIGPATSTIDLQFLEACFRNGLLNWWDGVSVHPYRQSAPETAAPEYRQLRALIERYKPKGKTVPILSGEWGYSSVWKDFDENRQGKYLPRQWLLNQYQEIPISIWYDWYDDGPDAAEAEHHFGTVQNTFHAVRTPPFDAKPAYIAAQTLTQNLNGFSFNKRLWTGREQDWVLLFTRANEVRLACWTTDETAHEITLPASDGAFARVNYLGEKLADVNAEKQKLTLSLSDGVQYLWPRKVNALLKQATDWQRVPLETLIKAPFYIEPPAIAIDTNRTRVEFVTRDVKPADSLMNLTLAEAIYQQSTGFGILNPLFATPVFVTKDSVAVQISNPTGEAFSGKLDVWNTVERRQQPLVVAAGEYEKTLTVALRNPITGSVSVGAEIADAENQVQTSHRSLRFVPIEDFARPNAAADYAVVADGDAKIASTQTLKIEAAPEPLLGQNVQALRLDYRWDAGWKFVQVLPPNELKIEGQPRAIQMWIYGDGNGHRARLRLRDAGGQTLQPNGEVIDWKGWRAVTFPLETGKMGHWGGANDGEIHGALSWDSLFLLDSAGKSAGTIYLAAPTLIYDAN